MIGIHDAEDWRSWKIRRHLYWLKSPALELCKSAVHAEEVCCKQAGLLSPCASPDLQNHLSIISFISGQKLEQNGPFQARHLSHQAFCQSPFAACIIMASFSSFLKKLCTDSDQPLCDFPFHRSLKFARGGSLLSADQM